MSCFDVEVTVNGRPRTIRRGLNECHICCEMKVNIPMEGEIDVKTYYIDGRITCFDCQHALTVDFISSQSYVCINVLCRRKWKQLSPRIVPFFCPSCRKSLEGMLGESISGEYVNESGEIVPFTETKLNLDYLRRLYGYWLTAMFALNGKLIHERAIWRPTDVPPIEMLQSMSLSQILPLFINTFKSIEIPVDACRNWNSMLVRKRYFKGTVVWKDQGMCHLIPHLELNDNFVVQPVKTEALHDQGLRFFALDWKAEIFVGQTVYFIAFPNPVIDDRIDCVQHIIKIINGPDGGEKIVKEPKNAKNKKETKVKNESPKNSMKQVPQHIQHQHQTYATHPATSSYHVPQPKNLPKPYPPHASLQQHPHHQQNQPMYASTKGGRSNEIAAFVNSELEAVKARNSRNSRVQIAGPGSPQRRRSTFYDLGSPCTQYMSDEPFIGTPSMFTPPSAPRMLDPVWVRDHFVTDLLYEGKGLTQDYSPSKTPVYSKKRDSKGYESGLGFSGQNNGFVDMGGDFDELMQWTDPTDVNVAEGKWYEAMNSTPTTVDTIANGWAAEDKNSESAGLVSPTNSNVSEGGLHHIPRGMPSGSYESFDLNFQTHCPPVPEDEPATVDQQRKFVSTNRKTFKSIGGSQRVPPQSPFASYFD